MRVQSSRTSLQVGIDGEVVPRSRRRSSITTVPQSLRRARPAEAQARLPRMPGIFDTVVDPKFRRCSAASSACSCELRETLEREQVEERRRVDELLATLEDLFTIVIVGEFNAGKSSLINALFGAKLRTEGPIPVDDVISILRYGERPRSGRSPTSSSSSRIRSSSSATSPSSTRPARTPSCSGIRRSPRTTSRARTSCCS